MSTFSCQTGRYCPSGGDVIVFKGERDDDEESIFTEADTANIGTTQGTSITSRTQLYSTNSTLTNREIADGASTIPVNTGNECNNYEILLKRQEKTFKIPQSESLTQTGTS